MKSFWKRGFFNIFFEKNKEFQGLQIFWIRDAGHNSNTDKPEEVNRIIREFAEGLGEEIQ